MNPKIRELAEQVGFFPVPDETEWDWEYRAENARYEKFAELIIRECENLCQHRVDVLQKHLDERGIDMDKTAFYFTKGVISGSIRNAQRIRGLLNNERKY